MEPAGPPFPMRGVCPHLISSGGWLCRSLSCLCGGALGGMGKRMVARLEDGDEACPGPGPGVPGLRPRPAEVAPPASKRFGARPAALPPHPLASAGAPSWPTADTREPCQAPVGARNAGNRAAENAGVQGARNRGVTTAGDSGRARTARMCPSRLAAGPRGGRCAWVARMQRDPETA